MGTPSLIKKATPKRPARTRTNGVKRRKPKTTGLQSAKPYADFPLSVHASGRWYKSINGRKVFFGKVEDGFKSAIELYEANRDALFAGEIRTPLPRGAADAATVYDLCEAFMDAKDADLASGEIVRITWRNYSAGCRELIKAFGENRTLDSLSQDDFARFRLSLSKRMNATSLNSVILRVRVLFKFAFTSKLIKKPMDFGAGFKSPRPMVFRRERKRRGPRMLEPWELRRLLKEAKQPLHAMILLGLNGGLGPSDLGQMPMSAINWEQQRLDYPRPKTEVDRTVPLWDETLKSLRDAVAARPKPRRWKHGNLVFLTPTGLPWHKDTDTCNPLSKRFRKLLDDVGIYRAGTSFYSLRHIFETIAGGCTDQVAVDVVMGHADSSMAARYREKVDYKRLQRAVNEVHAWLFSADG